VEATYRYGSTANGTREPHHGVEFSNESGTPVYAAGRGMVVFAGPDQEAIYSPWENFYGNLVVIEHADGLFTLYAHLSKIDAQTGQEVFTTDKIGEVGRTGAAIGSHLHFEVRRGNGEDYFATQNPELWLVPANDAEGVPFGTLMISVVDQERKLIKYAELTVRYYLDPSQRHVKSYYGTTYSPETLNGEENAVWSELPAGHYRIAVKANSKVYERWVEVESAKLTQVVFIVK
jgi:murein DD-endopeptidase MepM/ murein hydrolase activator NlpD